MAQAILPWSGLGAKKKTFSLSLLARKEKFIIKSDIIMQDEESAVGMGYREEEKNTPQTLTYLPIPPN